MRHSPSVAPTNELDPTIVVGIDKGMPGFPELSSLTITPIDRDSLFVWVAATESAQVAFLAVNPFVYFPEYEVELSSIEEGALAVAPDDDLIVYCLVTIDRAEGVATANLLAPLVINMNSLIAQQIILEGDHPLRARIPVPPMKECPK